MYYRAIDNAGNESDIGESKVNVIDTTAPELTLVANISEDVWVSEGGVTVTAIANEKDVTFYYYVGTSVDDAADDDWNPGRLWKMNENGRVWFKAVDIMGNESDPVSYDVTNIDTVDPMIDYRCEAADEGGYIFTVTVGDNVSGVAKVEYRYEGSEEWTELALTDNGYILKVMDENVTTYFRATDKAGNTSNEIKAPVDVTAPVLQVDWDWETPTRRDVVLTITAEDNEGGSGIGKIRYSFDNESWHDFAQLDEIDNGKRGELTVTENRTVYFKAVDMSGNETSCEVNVNNIDRNAPEISYSFANGSYTVTAADDKSGLEELYYSSDKKNWVRIENNTVSASGTIYFKAVDKAGNVTIVNADSGSVPADKLPANLRKTEEGLAWDAVAGAAGYVVELSADNFANIIRIVTGSNSVDLFELPAGDYAWRVTVQDGGTAVGTSFNVPAGAVEVKEIVSDKDGITDLFFAKANGTWSNEYAAEHQGVLDTWEGTEEQVNLAGKNVLSDIFEGSTDANILVMTDDANGDALFVDDIYSALPGTVAEQQARIAEIDEIRAGAGDDIIDMTSQMFAYTGNGVKIYGGLGNDTIWANNGSNTLFGDAGNDRLVGGSGDDILVGGSGNDSMHGGGGNDIFTFGGNFGNDTIEQLAGGTVKLWFEDGDAANWNADTLTYSDGTNSVTVKGITEDKVEVVFVGSDSLPAGAFADAASEKIFEDKDKALLA